MKDLCNRLSDATGLRFRIDYDTREPAAKGVELFYYMAASAGGYHLVANSAHEEFFAGDFGSESEMIDKINELENDFRYV